VVLGIVGLLLTLALALIPPLRRSIGRWFRFALFSLGFYHRRYSRWFIREYRRTYNIYLADYDELDLGETYVPLSLQPDKTFSTVARPSKPMSHRGSQTTDLQIATHVLSDQSAHRILVIGDRGSGKSTLLRAYGAGTLRRRRYREETDLRTIPKSAEIPFLVSLRRLARKLDENYGLTEFIIDEILVQGVGLSRDLASMFLRRLLKRGQCLVLLDGLDEVAADSYEAVRDHVLKFADSNFNAMPTTEARLVLTCRRQNFLGIAEDWVPALASRVYVLAPLRDAEMLRYLQKLRPRIPHPKSSESFFHSVRESGTFDLHRVPIVLAMSAGLYASSAEFEIPPSLSLLYERMIKELLKRDHYRLDPVGNPNRYSVRDKHRLLRDFALVVAERTGRFDDFEIKEIRRFAATMAPSFLDAEKPDAGAIVKEIVRHSGLLRETSDDGTLAFAHRSIHEFLAAEALLRTGDKAVETLSERANEPTWRQATLFFSGLSGGPVQKLLVALANKNLELAGHCLSSMDVAPSQSRPIIASLRKRISDKKTVSRYLPALLSAVSSPNQGTSTYAVESVQELLATDESGRVARLLSSDIGALLQVANALATTNDARVAALVPIIAENASPDPRLVSPLWRCLTAPNIDSDATACCRIITALLRLATGKNGLRVLNQQVAIHRDYLSDKLRSTVYPFKKGYALSSNLVTVLSWAYYQQCNPSHGVRYFEALRTGPKVLARVERARQFTLHVPLSLVGDAIFFGGIGVALAATLTWLVAEPERGFSQYGWATLLFLTTPVLLTFVFRMLLHPFFRKSTSGKGSGCLGVTLVPLLYAFTFIPLISSSILGYVLVSTAVTLVCSLLSSIDFYYSERRLYITRPNQFVDLYDDPTCGHWLVSETEQQGV
jgi:hypothetical protein